MPGARNVSPEVRAEATLQLIELCARDQMPDPDDPTSDFGFMSEALGILQSHLKTIKRQASAAWSKDFDAMLDRATQMRCVSIAPDSKDERRQKKRRCDACGRYEKWCGVAIDLAGEGEISPNDWFGAKQDMEDKVHRYLVDYDDHFECVPCIDEDTGLHDMDMGRFYTGATCLRKAQLHFLAATLLPELAVNAWSHVKWLDDETMATGELRWATAEAAAELLKLIEQLDLCIADERRRDMPEVSVDEAYWEIIDKLRAACTEDALKRCSKQALTGSSSAKGDSESEDGSDGEWVEEQDGSDGAESAEDDEEDDDEVLSSSQRRPRRAAAAPDRSRRKRRAVVDDDDEGEEEEEEVVELSDGADDDEEEVAEAVPPRRGRSSEAGASSSGAQAPAQARGAMRSGGQPTKRSARLAGLDPGEPVDVERVAAGKLKRGPHPVLQLGEPSQHNGTTDANAALGGAFNTGGASRPSSQPDVARPPKKRLRKQRDEEEVPDGPEASFSEMAAQPEEEEDEDGEEEELEATGPSQQDLDDLVDTRAAREGGSGGLRQGARQPAPIRVATAMRIPPSDGSEPRLASRRMVLLDAMKLAQEHTIEGNDERAARMDAVVTTLRELIAVAERARGTQGRA